MRVRRGLVFFQPQQHGKRVACGSRCGVRGKGVGWRQLAPPANPQGRFNRVRQVVAENRRAASKATLVAEGCGAR